MAHLPAKNWTEKPVCVRCHSIPRGRNRALLAKANTSPDEDGHIQKHRDNDLAGTFYRICPRLVLEPVCASSSTKIIPASLPIVK